MKKPIFNKGAGKNRSPQEAERLSMSEQSLVLLYKKGIVPATRVSARILLFDPVATDAALAEHAAKYGKDGYQESIYPKAKGCKPKAQKRKSGDQPVTV
jgi:hypothetical protein